MRLTRECLCWVFSAVSVSCYSDVPMAPLAAEPVTITLVITGPRGEAKTVRPIATLDGTEIQRWPATALDEMGRGSFMLTLQSGSRGKLAVTVHAIEDDALLSDSAQGTIEIDADKPYSLTLQLKPVDYCGEDAWCWERPRRVGTIFTDIWGTGTDDLWVVGMSGRPLHYDGFAFSEVPLVDDNAGTIRAVQTPAFYSVHGTSKTDVWAVSAGLNGRGMRRALWRYNGAAFHNVYTSELITNGDMPSFSSVLVTSRYVWVGGLRFDHDSVALLPTTLPFEVIMNKMIIPNPEMPEDIWSVGVLNNKSAIWHWDSKNETWQTEAHDGTGINSFGFVHVLGTSPDNLLASATQGGFVFQRQGTSWNRISSPKGVIFEGRAPDDLWLVSGGQGNRSSVDLLNWDGKSPAITVKKLPAPSGLGIMRVFAPTKDPQSPLFLIGEGGLIYRYNRNSKQLTTLLKGASTNPATLNDVYGFAVDDIWAVGDSGTITHYDGIRWKDVIKVTSNNLRRIWGTGSNDIWAVGDAGTIVRIDSKQPRVVASGTTANLRSVWGTGSNSVYAVGDQSTVLQWNGSTWSSTTVTGAQGSLQAVWASGDRGIWIGGNNAGVLSLVRYDGNAWDRVNITLPNQGPNVLNIRGSSSTNVLVGVSGSLSRGILRYNGRNWSVFPSHLPNGIATFGEDSVFSIGEEWSLFSSGRIQPGLMPGPRTFYGLWGSTASDLWAVGELGSILHLNPKSNVSW